ncbi:hypothetical protein AVEN_187279-1 [Araneus ventricosus]|uniref:Uncharacterized protein n=1 Tax=Araneus ventricosus TaxID=182803 RepID=A0A4Y2GR61_ARAVE|nr:hypothetical protein AVEN_187279-1 [Araneus ventricosus]
MRFFHETVRGQYRTEKESVILLAKSKHDILEFVALKYHRYSIRCRNSIKLECEIINIYVQLSTYDENEFSRNTAGSPTYGQCASTEITWHRNALPVILMAATMFHRCNIHLFLNQMLEISRRNSLLSSSLEHQGRDAFTGAAVPPLTPDTRRAQKGLLRPETQIQMYIALSPEDSTDASWSSFSIVRQFRIIVTALPVRRQCAYSATTEEAEERTQKKIIGIRNGRGLRAVHYHQP